MFKLPPEVWLNPSFPPDGVWQVVTMDSLLKLL